MECDKFILTPYYEFIKTVVPLAQLQIRYERNSPKDSTVSGYFVFKYSLECDTTLLLSESRKHKSSHFDIRILLRICKTTEEPHNVKQFSMEDCFPLFLTINVNNSLIKLTEILPYDNDREYGRRVPHPIDLTDTLFGESLSATNQCIIQWIQHPTDKFFFAIYLVRKRSYEEMSMAILKRPSRSITATLNVIMEDDIFIVNNGGNQPIEYTKTSLDCPISLTRMQIPVRGQKCTHLQCFDCVNYIVLNFMRPRWKCPICDQVTLFIHLEVDYMIMCIIKDDKSNLLSEIIFNKLGQWGTCNDNEDSDSYSVTFNEIIDCGSIIDGEQQTVINFGTETSINSTACLVNQCLQTMFPPSDWITLRQKFCSSKNLFTSNFVSQDNRQNNAFHIDQNEFMDSKVSLENGKINNHRSDKWAQSDNNSKVKNVGLKKPTVLLVSSFDMEKLKGKFSRVAPDPAGKIKILNYHSVKQNPINKARKSLIIDKRSNQSKPESPVFRNPVGNIQCNECDVMVIDSGSSCASNHANNVEQDEMKEEMVGDVELVELNAKSRNGSGSNLDREENGLVEKEKKIRKPRPGCQLGRPKKSDMSQPPSILLQELTKERIKAKYLQRFSGRCKSFPKREEECEDVKYVLRKTIVKKL